MVGDWAYRDGGEGLAACLVIEPAEIIEQMGGGFEQIAAFG